MKQLEEQFITCKEEAEKQHTELQNCKHLQQMIHQFQEKNKQLVSQLQDETINYLIQQIRDQEQCYNHLTKQAIYPLMNTFMFLHLWTDTISLKSLKGIAVDLEKKFKQLTKEEHSLKDQYTVF